MAKPKLNQIVAIEKGVKSRVYAELTHDQMCIRDSSRIERIVTWLP